MASKLQLITAMYEHHIKKLAEIPFEWQKFLCCASYNYKLPFDEQILVYAQRPDATAVLELDKWNKQFGRWVNKGATGIAVVNSDTTNKRQIKYYFDILDTHEGRFSRPVPTWNVKPEHEQLIIETLDATFGEFWDKETLDKAIKAAVDYATDDNIADYLSDLQNNLEGSLLDTVDDIEFENITDMLIHNSVLYQMLYRCGIDPETILEPDAFDNIRFFNTPETITILGGAIGDISQMGLKEIATTVLNLQKQEKNRTFANNNKPNYNEVIKDERGFESGTDIQRNKRVQDSRLDTTNRAGSRTWQVRINAPKLPPKQPQGTVQQSTDERQAEPTPTGNRADSDGAVGVTDSIDGESGGSNGTTQTERHAELDRHDDEHSQQSGGNDASRADLQLTLLTPEQQQRNIEKAESTIERVQSAFTYVTGKLPQEVIDEALCMGSGVVEGKFRIYEQFEKSLSNKENAEFLKNEYGTGGYHPALGLGMAREYNSKGITVTFGDENKVKTQQYLNWTEITKRIGELIAVDRYLNPKEKEQYPSWLTEKEERQAQRDKEIAAREILSREPTAIDTTEYTYEYRLGDTVYIGAHEYEIISLSDDNVELYDSNFPIINKFIPREEFDTKVRENPMNNHLRSETPSEQDAISSVLVEQVREELLRRELAVSDDVIEVSIDEYRQGGWQRDGYSDIADYIEEELNKIEQEVNADYELSEEQPHELASSSDTISDVEIAQEIEPDSSSEIESEIEPTDEFKPAWENKKPTRANYIDAFPKAPMSERINFKITDDNLGHGGAKAKFKANMAAIELLQELEIDGRLANSEEQEILSKFVGWGGLSQAFDPDNSSWDSEYIELKNSITSDEYEAARASTLNAHYTSPTVIKAMYKAIENMGFKSGNILEPGCGTGNFQGLLPDSMSDSKMYGIEIDSITGRIAAQLYQKNSIAIQGYENTNLPDSFFDLAIGNVPFGNYGVLDKKYDKYKFSIHDYFFAKTLDKVRPGGVIAFVTSSFTMDKKNPSVRKYIAQRAELLGAIRLPNNAFLANAGTQVTTDIIFLQKRDRVIDIEPDWVYLSETEDGIPLNSYFVDNPDMILGTMTNESGMRMYGNENSYACEPYPDRELSDLLDEAIQNIHAEITEYELEDEQDIDDSIPADPQVRNFSFAVVDGAVYFREDSRMKPCSLSATAENRVKGMIGIRDCVRLLIEYQTEDYSDNDIKAEQVKLNRLYDNFTSKYGHINSRANISAFSSDSSFPLLSALEILDENGKLRSKADMFTQRTIRPKIDITHVDTASEALAVSLGEKAKVDLEYMSELTGKSQDELIKELEGVIFFDIANTEEYITAGEYLSGNVREKLALAKEAQSAFPDGRYNVNVNALESVQPVDLTASEISVRLGTTWLPVPVVQQFMYELLDTPNYARWRIKVNYSKQTAEWGIENKNYDRSNVKAYSTYGTGRANAYKIFEETLNLRDVRIFDYVEDEFGKKTAVLNKKETMIAQAKQEQIKSAFGEWVWKDPSRRELLCGIYNEKFNSVRPREYDGSHIRFVGMNPTITLREHQINAIARIIYGGNTLLAHEMGAGKTFEMIAAAMEMKRLNLCNKSMVVVPNHIIEQFAAEWLQLYPSANILVATKKDFEPKNRRKFCARIATSDIDAVIIGHSQFEKIPMSMEFQRSMLENQLSDLIVGISEARKNDGNSFTVKQLEKSRKSLQLKLNKLNDQSRKDDFMCFEELGVNRLFVDEAHGYKNLFLYTKMRNVGGIQQTEAQKSSDMFMKTRYLDKETDGRGVIFATGTPVTNSMVELYSMQRYLQYGALQKSGLIHFDEWASTFGETVTAIELSPEGSGFRAKTRFAKFFNLPELMTMFREVADIQTNESLNLPVPKANFHNVVVSPSDMQIEMVEGLAERAELVRNREVDPSVDNMLCITNDGRKLALDQRLMNPMLPDHDGNKSSTAAENIFRHWDEGKDKKLTQLVFCDLSTPKNDGSFSVYEDLRDKLIAKGVPSDEIAFIHSADTETKRKELLAKVRQGTVRVLMGSTFKCGSGMNVQDKIVALHRLDCPWRPADIAQQNGRAIRQGNSNPEVEIYTYITEKTFDGYSYQLIENKQRFISQIMTNKSPVRSADDIDEQSLSYAEIKALATGNPLIIEKCNLEVEVNKLNIIKSSFLSQKYALEDKIIKHYPADIKRLTERIDGYSTDIATATANTPANKEDFTMKIGDVIHGDKKAAGSALLDKCKAMTGADPVPLGQYRGFEMELFFDSFNSAFNISLKGALTHVVALGFDDFGNITRLNNLIDGFEEKRQSAADRLEAVKSQLETAKAEVENPFPQEVELNEKTKRLKEVNIALNLDKRENEIVESTPDAGDNMDAPERKDKGYER